MVGRHGDRGGAFGGAFGGARTFTGLSNFYSMVYAPLVAGDADPVRVLSALASGLRARQPRYDALRFQPLDRASPLYGALQDALRGAGWVVQPYFHLGNWYETTAGMRPGDYLARRPAELRNTIRRKAKLLDRAGARA